MGVVELLLLLGGLTLLSGLLLLVIGRMSRTPVMIWWGAAYLLASAGLGLGLAPRLFWLSYGLGNALVLAGYGIMAEGLRRFSGKAPGSTWLFLPALAWLLASALPPLSGDVLLRIVVFGLLAAASVGCITWEFITIRERPLARLPIIGVCALHGLFYLARSAAVGAQGVGPQGEAWFLATIIEAILFIFCDTLLFTSLVRAIGERKLREAARRDYLTGALNRGGFTEAAEAALARRGGTLLLLDLDDFKQLNDSQGHAAGDAILRELTRVCRACAPAGALIGRLGGDEFAVLIEGGADEGAALAEAIRAAFRAASLARGAGTQTSIGLAEARAAGQPLARLLAEADAALYRIKPERRLSRS